jgi:hypothetical protein
MQRQFTIELRVDYADKDKNAIMRTALAEAARHIFAKATVLADGQAPDIAIFSEDFFDGREVMNLMDDTTVVTIAPADGISQGLLDAVREEQEDEAARNDAS